MKGTTGDPKEGYQVRNVQDLNLSADAKVGCIISWVLTERNCCSVHFAIDDEAMSP